MLKRKLLGKELRVFESWKTYREFMAAQNHSEALELLKTRNALSSAEANEALLQVGRTHTLVQNLLRTVVVILALMWLVGAVFNVILLVEVFTDELPWGLSPVFVSGIAVIWFWLPTLTIPELIEYGIKGEDNFRELYNPIISPDLKE